MADDKTTKTKTVRATVARGRTVSAPHPTKKRVIGFTADGKPIECPDNVDFGPGQELELTTDEVATLRRSGYLVDPATPALPLAAGASVTDQANDPAPFARIGN